MFEVHVFIPLKSNHGRKFSASHHVAFEAFVLARFGGLSRMPGTVEGKWIAEKTTYVDDLVVYAIAVKSIVDGHLVHEVVAFAKVHYEQEAIYVRYLGISEIL